MDLRRDCDNRCYAARCPIRPHHHRARKMGGHPCIRGMRITGRRVLEILAQPILNGGKRTSSKPSHSPPLQSSESWIFFLTAGRQPFDKYLQVLKVPHLD
jgi:hypothetical protein